MTTRSTSILYLKGPGGEPIPVSDADPLPVTDGGATLEELTEQGRPATSGILKRFPAGVGTATALPAQATPRGFVVKVASTAANTVFFGFDAGITTSGANRGFPVDPGEMLDFDLDEMSKVYAISASAVECVAIVEVRE